MLSDDCCSDGQEVDLSKYYRMDQKASDFPQEQHLCGYKVNEESKSFEALIPGKLLAQRIFRRCLKVACFLAE